MTNSPGSLVGYSASHFAGSAESAKTRFLATGTVEAYCAWAVCSPSDHGNILVYWQFHDLHSYLLGIASVLLLAFVTLECRFGLDL